jgi:hypothetical protein
MPNQAFEATAYFPRVMAGVRPNSRSEYYVCGPRDVFDDEHVCIHVFNSNTLVPKPLLKSYRRVPGRPKRGRLFRVGIPELLVCTTTSGFLNLFQYFWPVSRDEFRYLQEQISVQFEKGEITGRGDIDDLARYLRTQGDELRPGSAESAVVLTLNDYTRYWSSDVIALWRESAVEEFVVIKDPRRAPYLCDYPSPQKGFKRTPP